MKPSQAYNTNTPTYLFSEGNLANETNQTKAGVNTSRNKSCERSDFWSRVWGEVTFLIVIA